MLAGMRKEFVLDNCCPTLNSMNGWKKERKTNVNDMFGIVQSLYKGESGEIAILFSKIESDGTPNGFLYNITDDAIRTSMLLTDGEWHQDIDGAVNTYINKAGLDADDYKSCTLRLCVWHNHHRGTDFSTADIALIVDYFPIIHESYIDVDYVLRMVPSKQLKSKLDDEAFKSTFLASIRDLRNKIAKEQKNEIDYLDNLHLPSVYKLLEDKTSASRKGEDSNSLENEFSESSDAYAKSIELVRKKYDEKINLELEKIESNFEIFRFMKKERDGKNEKYS